MRGPIAGEFHCDRIVEWSVRIFGYAPPPVVRERLREDARRTLAAEGREDLLPHVWLRVRPDLGTTLHGGAGWYVCEGHEPPLGEQLFV